MSNVIKVETLDELLGVLAEEPKVMVVFSAVDWCIPCRKLAPHVVAVAEMVNDIVFVDVDIDHVEGVQEEFNIMTVPTVKLFENGKRSADIKSGTALQILAELKR